MGFTLHRADLYHCDECHEVYRTNARACPRCDAEPDAPPTAPWIATAKGWFQRRADGSMWVLGSNGHLVTAPREETSGELTEFECGHTYRVSPGLPCPECAKAKAKADAKAEAKAEAEAKAKAKFKPRVPAPNKRPPSRRSPGMKWAVVIAVVAFGTGGLIIANWDTSPSPEPPTTTEQTAKATTTIPPTTTRPPAPTTTFAFALGWVQGGCVDVGSAFITPVSCSSPSANGEIVTITYSDANCPNWVEYYADLDDGSVACIDLT